MALEKSASGTEVLTVASLAVNTRSDPSTEIDTSNALQLAIEVDITFNASAALTSVYTLEMYGSMATGTGYSTKPYASRNLVVEPGIASVQIFGVPCPMRYIKAKIFNDDDTYAATLIVVKSAMQTVT